MTDLQKVEFDILVEFDRICRKFNLKYFLFSGTLLGAVRHGGFIPWDDDIDVAMPINDYYKFVKICKTELGEDYFLQTYNTDYVNFWYAKIRKNNTTMLESGFENVNMHHGVWIDIFPYFCIEKDDSIINQKLNKVLNIKKLNKK